MIITLLDKVFPAGSYKAEDNKGYVIRKIGTDSAAGIMIKIGRAEIFKVKKEICPLFASAEHLIGPLDLKDLPLIVPPGYEVEFDGTGNTRLIGDLIILEPGEAFPDELMERFGAQVNRHFEILEGTYTVAAGTTWKDGSEIKLYEEILPVRLTYIMRHLLLIKNPDPKVISEEKIGVTIFKDDVAWDITMKEMGPFGLNVQGCPLPPRSVPLLEARTQTLTGDGTTKAFSLPTEYTPIVKLLRCTPEVAGVPAHVMPIDLSTIYVCKISVTATADADADIPMASGETIDVTYDFEKYPPAPDKLDFEVHPIEYPPGSELEVRLRNISGADYTPTSSQTFKAVIIVEFRRA